MEDREVLAFTTKDKTTYDVNNDPNCKKITYHQPVGEGDAHYVDVFYENGVSIRFFNVSVVIFKGQA